MREQSKVITSCSNPNKLKKCVRLYNTTKTVEHISMNIKYYYNKV